MTTNQPNGQRADYRNVGHTECGPGNGKTSRQYFCWPTDQMLTETVNTDCCTRPTCDWKLTNGVRKKQAWESAKQVTFSERLRLTVLNLSHSRWLTENITIQIKWHLIVPVACVSQNFGTWCSGEDTGWGYCKMGSCRGHLGLTGRGVRGKITGRRSFTIWNGHQVLLEWSNWWQSDGWGMWHVWEEKCLQNFGLDTRG